MTDPDDHLSPQERTRRALHRAVDRILVAWPHALADAAARGYTNRSYGTKATATLTSVEAAAAVPCRAVGWLAELNDIVIHLTAVDMWPRLDDFGNDTVRGLAGMLLHRRVDQLHEEAWIARIINLGNKAVAYWPTLAKGDTIAGVTVGARGNLVEECGLCGNPVVGGAQDPIRRIDGQAFHRSPCWYTATVARARTPQRHPPQQGAA